MAIEVINDDYFLAYIGSIGFFLSGVLAIAYGKILDSFEFRKINLVFLSIDLVICALIPLAINYKYFYAILVIVEIGIGGNSFITVWLMSEKIYKNERWVVSLLSLSLILDFAAVYSVDNYIRFYLGNIAALGICFGVILISLLLLTVDLEKRNPNEERLLEMKEA